MLGILYYYTEDKPRSLCRDEEMNWGGEGGTEIEFENDGEKKITSLHVIRIRLILYLLKMLLKSTIYHVKICENKLKR